MHKISPAFGAPTLSCGGRGHRVLQLAHVYRERESDILALTNAAAFGRATRIKQLVSELSSKLLLRDPWQVEVAAMLSQLAHVTLPADTAERLYFGRPLSLDEQRQVDHLPAVTEQLLGNIPRIESVRKRGDRYALTVIRALLALRGTGAAPETLRKVAPSDLLVGSASASAR